MSLQTHNVEGEGSKTRDHAHPRRHFWKRAHRDWRVWAAVLLMVALILVYVMSDNLLLRPNRGAVEPTPKGSNP